MSNAILTIALKGDIGTSWHISTQSKISIKSLVEMICKIFDKEYSKIVVEEEERLGKDKSYLLDSNAIRMAFGWEDKISLKEGIMETYNWINYNYEKIKEMNWEYEHKI